MSLGTKSEQKALTFAKGAPHYTRVNYYVTCPSSHYGSRIIGQHYPGKTIL